MGRRITTRLRVSLVYRHLPSPKPQQEASTVESGVWEQSRLHRETPILFLKVLDIQVLWCSPWEGRDRRASEFVANPVYIASFRFARATESGITLPFFSFQVESTVLPEGEDAGPTTMDDPPSFLGAPHVPPFSTPFALWGCTCSLGKALLPLRSSLQACRCL